MWRPADRCLAIVPMFVEAGITPQAAAERVAEAAEEPMGLGLIFVVPAETVRRYEVGVYQVPE